MSSNGATSLTLDGGTLLIRAPFVLKDVLKETVPARRWDKTRKVWTAPATPFVYEHIRNMPAEIRATDDATAQWVEKAELSLSDTQRQYDIETARKPWRHQSEAYCFVRQRMSSILHMHMGTGKTKVVIDVALNERHGRVLVFCPLQVIEAWRKQIDRDGMGAIDFFALDGTGSEKKAKQLRQLLARKERHPTVVVVNYESAWRKALASLFTDKANRWDMVAFDEVHKLKSPSGRAARFGCDVRMNADKVVGMTGTLMPNGPLDIYGICRAVDVGLFGSSFTRFRARYAVMGGYGDHQVLAYQNQDELADHLARITYRASKDVLNMPPVTVSNCYFYLDTATAKLYAQMEETFIASLPDGNEVAAVNSLSKQIKLRQLCSGFMYDENHQPVSVSAQKESVLKDYLSDIGKEPLVVFFNFTAEATSIHSACAELGLSYSELSGHRKELDEWQRGETQVIAVQMKTGSLGIDLTRAAFNFYYSLDWNLGDYEQSRERSDRPGQTRHVTVTHCLAAQTVDDDVADALTNKQKVIDVVLARMRVRTGNKKGAASPRQNDNAAPQHTGA